MTRKERERSGGWWECRSLRSHVSSRSVERKGLSEVRWHHPLTRLWSRVRGCLGVGSLDRGWSHSVLSDGVLALELVNSGSQPGVRRPWISG